MSQVYSNQKRRWLKRLLNVGAPKALLLAPALLCPIVFAEPTQAQQVSATRSISDGTVVVDKTFVLGWLDYAKQMANSDKLDAAVPAFAEALRGQQQLPTKDPAVDQRIKEVATVLASKKVTPDQVRTAHSGLGSPRALPIGTKLPVGQPAVMQASNNQVVTAGSGTQAAPVLKGVFVPSQDQSQLRQASTQVQVAPTAFAPTASGDELYQKGLELLASGDRKAAKEAFLEAWKFQSELNPAIRNSLKDKLTALQASSPEAVTGVPMSPADEAAIQENNRWISEVTGEISDAKRFRESEPMVVAERLQTLRTRVSQANLNGDSRKRLLTIVDREVADHQIYMSQNKATIDQNTRNSQIKEQISREQEERYKIDQEIASKIEIYNDLMDKGDFMQAEMIAKQVGALDPNSQIAALLISSARNKRRIGEYESIVRKKEDGLIDTLQDVDRAAIPTPDDKAFQLPEGWGDLSKRRLASQERESSRGMSPAERGIWEKLKQPVMVNFTQRPLTEVISTLQQMTGIPFHIDGPSLAKEGINSDTMVTLDLPSQISLRSALALLLNSRNLDFQVGNEVLMITSASNTSQANRTYTYNVKDLVIPIPNFVTDNNSGLGGALRHAYESLNAGLAARTQQRISGTDIQLASASLNPSSGALGQLQPGGGMPGMGMGGMGMGGGGFNNMGGGFGQGMGGGFGSSFGGPRMGGPPLMSMGGPTPIAGGAAMADFDTLMNLIQQTIDPDSWLATGGSSTMIQYPANLSIVISAPQTTHEKIADLLESLRRLQDLQVTIEVKFITLTDNFFENIGVDFDLRFEEGRPELPTNEAGGGRAVIGLSTGASAANPFPFTSNLDVVFDQSNTVATTPFGGVAGAGANLGFAILSDIEMFFFMNAAQGDSRTNVLQAPRVTMFDGQQASINDTVSRPFVTSLIPVVGDFAVAQQPVIVVLNEGTVLNVQATVSPDKRNVRLTLNPNFSQIDRVDTFTFEGSRTSRRNSNTTGTNLNDPDEAAVTDDEEEEEEVITGTTVQQPSISITSVATTVSVPDGGTILLGGIKRMREGRTERGVPILSKIPYINRLFRNTSIGRETSTLMLTVTPRIIIQEEEEMKLGVTP